MINLDFKIIKQLLMNATGYSPVVFLVVLTYMAIIEALPNYEISDWFLDGVNFWVGQSVRTLILTTTFVFFSRYKYCSVAKIATIALWFNLLGYFLEPYINHSYYEKYYTIVCGGGATLIWFIFLYKDRKKRKQCGVNLSA